MSVEVLERTHLVDLGNEFYAAELYDHAREMFLLATSGDDSPEIELKLGQCENRMGEVLQAEQRARRLLLKHEHVAAVWLLLVECLVAQKAFKAAFYVCNQALTCTPGDARVYSALGLVSGRLGELEAALDAYSEAFALDPSDSRILSTLVSIKRKLCDWYDLPELSQSLRSCVARGAGDIPPFAFLAEGATAAEELVCARSFVRRSITNHVALSPRCPHTHGPLRIGFVSHGFGEHATTILTAAFFEQLQKLGPQVHLFATNADHGSAPRRRLQGAVQQLHDVAGQTPYVIAERIRSTEVDVLVDLDGHSKGAMPRVFALRCAPVQVSWLGYPGTSGVPEMDNIVADRFVLPESMRPHFSETVAYLPCCFQPSDPTRRVMEPPSREACGLPAQGMVFACFNASFKINPRSFARMLCVLRQVPGSVLWLLKGDGRSAERLRAAARKLGINPSRLIFMERQSHSKYLACFRHVDLFLDTEHYGAHTTASDALWAGCPVLTRPGETFATRVAGSLNYHLGVGECNVDSDDAFVAEAIRYGMDVKARVALREKVERQRRESGLFDMDAYARNFVMLLDRLVADRRVDCLA